MVDYKANPEKALEVLLKLTDEIPSGVSGEDIGKILPVIKTNQDNVAIVLHNSFSKSVKSVVTNFWEDNALNDKLRELNKLENDFLVNTCFFPEQMDDKDYVEREFLLHRKKKLQQSINKMKSASSQIRKNLILQSNLIEKQTEDLKSIPYNNLVDM